MYAYRPKNMAQSTIYKTMRTINKGLKLANLRLASSSCTLLLGPITKLAELGQTLVWLDLAYVQP